MTRRVLCEWNYLLNPEHPDAAKLKIESVARERFDNRLFPFGVENSALPPPA